MDPFSAWVEGTWLSSTMRDTTWLWPLCESIHFIGLALLIGGAGYFDLRLIGFMRRVPVAAAKAFMPWAIAGFAMNLVTGTAFFIMAPHMYVLSPPWWAKVFFIVLAGLNAMFFETRLGTRVMLLGPLALRGGGQRPEGHHREDERDHHPQLLSLRVLRRGLGQQQTGDGVEIHSV